VKEKGTQEKVDIKAGRHPARNDIGIKVLDKNPIALI